MKIVTYLRVSTVKQGQSGLGLEAQAAAIDAYVEHRSARILGRFVEVESGKHNDRPELVKALHLARVTGATLVIAKLDRLSRNAAFLLAPQDSGVRFVAADMPEANELTDCGDHGARRAAGARGYLSAHQGGPQGRQGAR
jgi:hypothetical protein